MRYWTKLIFVLLIATSITSCGFKAVLHHELNFTYNFLQNIELIHLTSCEGTYYYNYLKSLLPPVKQAKYFLETKLSYSTTHGFIQKNSDILKEIITIHVIYKLFELRTKKLITSGHFSKTESHTTDLSPYENQINHKTIKKLLAIISAEEVRNQLILFNKKK